MYLSATSFIFLPVRMQRMWNVWILRCAPSEILMRYLRMCWGNFDYAALGHIHKPMKVGSELYRYCGTPLARSVSEAQQQKGIIMVEMGVKGGKNNNFTA